MTQVKGSQQRKKVVANSKQAVSDDVSNYRLNFLRKHSVTIICVFLTVAICSVYLQVKDHQFIYLDDGQYVTENSHVLSGLNLENIKWAFTSVYARNWHPLTWISHMVDVGIFGMKPGMHHLTNVIFHALNSILLFIVLNQMTGALWRSAIVAALFALHPLHVESVAWIAERKDVLSTFFWMLTMLAYHRYVGSRTISKYLLMILFFSLGLMAKPMLVTLPFVLLLLDFWPLKREELNLANNGSQTEQSWWPKINLRDILRLILERVPLIIMALAACGVTVYAQSGGAVLSLEKLSFASRIQNVITAYIAYLWKMIWPLNLAVFYPYPKQFSILTVGMCLLLLIAITVIVLMSARRLPYLVTGWLWYLGTLVPVIGIVQVGTQSMADRYTYIPLIGIFIMIAWGIPELLEKWKFKKITLVTLTGIVIPILIGCSWVQVGYWKSNNTLFEHALDVTENNDVAHDIIADVLINQGDFDDALKHCAEALKINPYNAGAYDDMGIILTDRGEVSKAISYYSKAIQIDSNYVDPYINLGNAFITQDNNIEAVKQFSKVIEIEPECVLAYIKMSEALTKLGRLNEAIHQYHKVLQIKPDSIAAHYNLGIALISQGKINESIDQFKKVLGIQPGNVRAQKALSYLLAKRNKIEESVAGLNKELENESNKLGLFVKLGDIYQSGGDLGKAAENYERVVSIEPLNIHALNRLSRIYSDWGEYEKALDAMEKVIKVQPDIADTYYNIACIYAKQNKVDESISWLKQAIEKGFNNWDLLKKDPDIASIRNTTFINELIKNH